MRPEWPDVAVPVAVAGPVAPESALPDAAVVRLVLTELAAPVVPPVVVPEAELLPLFPDVAPAVESSIALPVRPEWADPLALPDVTVWVGWGGFPPPQADPAPAVPAARRSEPPTSPDARSVCLIRVLMVDASFQVVAPVLRTWGRSATHLVGSCCGGDSERRQAWGCPGREVHGSVRSEGAGPTGWSLRRSQKT